MGIVVLDNTFADGDIDAVTGTARQSDTMIDQNRFFEARNVPIHVDNQLRNVRGSRNHLQGPAQFSDSRFALKFGYGFGWNDPANLLVDYNTIADWTEAYPYVTSFKVSNSTYRGNLITDGRLTLRSGNDNVVEGNVILNGGMHISGERHVIRNNYVRTVVHRHHFGPLTLTARATTNNVYGNYNCVVKAWRDPSVVAQGRS